MIKSLETLIAACPKRTVTLEVPNSKESLELTELSVKDRADYYQLRESDEKSLDYMAGFVIARSSGFIDDDQIDQLIAKIGPTTLNGFALEVLRISGMLSTGYENAEKN